MAIHNVLVRATPEQVWQVLADGWAYEHWVAGTRKIREVDEGWPATGASIHFTTVGVGPVKLQDRTTSRLVEPARRLELEIHAGALGTARLSIELLPWGDEDTVLLLDEHPLSGPGKVWHNLLVEAVLRVRNRHMLQTLAELVEARFPKAAAV